MKIWHVEDAGGGCRAFGEVVVLVCEETREVYSARIPVTWTNKMGWEELVCQLMLGLMKEAKATSEDKYLVCSGNIFNVYHNWLKDHNYNWETYKMDGLAHDAAEGEFHRMVVETGFPEDIKLEDRDYRSYYTRIEQWVSAESDRKKLYWKDREVRKKPTQPRYILKSTMGRLRICGDVIKRSLPLVPQWSLSFARRAKNLDIFIILSAALQSL